MRTAESYLEGKDNNGVGSSRPLLYCELCPAILKRTVYRLRRERSLESWA